MDLRANVCCGCCYRMDVVGGSRFLHRHEGFGLAATEIGAGPNAPTPVGTRTDVADRFGTGNRLHGGDLGVDAEVRRGRLSVDLLARGCRARGGRPFGDPPPSPCYGDGPYPGPLPRGARARPL